MQELEEKYVGSLLGDHARFSRVLSLLGRDARRLEDEPDDILPLLGEAVDYIVNYQNIHHHPPEETIFLRLAQRSDALAPVVAQLTKEHKAMGRAGKQMQTLLAQVSRGTRGRKARQALAHKLESFARDMRTHIGREEELLYSRVWSELDEQDWRELAGVKLSGDPLESSEDELYPLLTRYVLKGAGRSEVVLRNPTVAQRLEASLGRDSLRGRKIRQVGVMATRHRREACALARKSVSALPGIPPLHPWDSLQSSLKSTRKFGQAYGRWLREWRAWARGENI